jgi:hypothetical protein
LNFDHVTLKSIGIMLWSCQTSMPNIKTVGQKNLKLLGRQAF